MRCPECNQRNSVAAKKCAACDSNLHRKPLPLSLKVFLGTLASIVFVFWLAALSSTLNNPEKNLTSTASNLTGKSKSPEQMMGNIKYFDQAMRRFLQKYGSLSDTDLSNKLSTCLPKSLYESHIFELLPNLKLIEIDTALNASNYLILHNNGQTEVLPIIGLDVYDSNSFLPQNNKTEANKKANEGQLLVLLGHTANVQGHQPRVKVLLLSSTLQSDNVVDLTDNVIPKFYGEGSAKFSPNQKDIELSISLFSRGQELNIFSPDQLKASLPVENESLYEQLIWQNNAYSLRSQAGTSKLYALYATASSLKNHNRMSKFRAYLSPAARHTIEQTPVIKNDRGFTISAYKANRKLGNTSNIYILKNDFIRAIVELRPIANGKKGAGSTWYVNSLSISKVVPTASPIPLATIPADAKALSTHQEPVKLPNIEEKNKSAEIKTETKSTNPEIVKTTTPKIEPTTSTTINRKSVASALKPAEQDAAPASFVPELQANVKLRSGPGTNYPPIYEVKANKRISIIGKENGWYRVKVDDKEGFIYAGLVKNQKNNAYRTTIIKQGCNVRDDQHQIISSVKTGEHLVLISGLKNNRYKIMLSNGKTGYVSKEAIDGTPIESPPLSVP